MKVAYICGCDGNECKKYKVKLDREGNIKPQEIKCTLNDCDRCYFMAKPWARIEMINK